MFHIIILWKIINFNKPKLLIILFRSVYPKKTQEIDYNKFSPYTPIQYYVDPVTKYQHHHIDLVGYLNNNQVNLDNYYFKNYQDSYTEDNSKDYVRNYHDPYTFLEKSNGHH